MKARRVPQTQGKQWWPRRKLLFFLELQFSGGFLSTITIDLKDSSSTTQVNKWSRTLNIGTGTTAALSITGPAFSDNYTGPTQMQVWRDNIYGTFMFFPVN